MGKRNRRIPRNGNRRDGDRHGPGRSDRDAELRRGRQSAGSHASHQVDGGPYVDPGEVIDAAIAAIRGGRDWAVEDLVRRLQGAEWGERVRSELVTRLEKGLATLWERGWQPADVVRVARRRLGKAAGGVVALAVVAQSRAYAQWGRAVASEWMDQVDGLGADVDADPPDAARSIGSGPHSTAAAIQVLALLSVLPTLPELMSPPSAWPNLRPGDAADRGHQILDPGLLEKIRALLSKAESTEFDAEAEALTAKAQELMTRHRIDRAVLAGEKPRSAEVIGRRVGIDDPYARQKFVLLSNVASANGCQAAWSKSLGFATVFGHPHDLAGVEELFTSLLVQATRAMQRQRPLHLRGEASATARFRRSFMIGFAHRIGQRLAAASDDAVSAVEAETGVALVPVLAARERAAEEAMRTTLGRVGTMSVSATDGVGYLLGREAADSADLRVAGGGRLPG